MHIAKNNKYLYFYVGMKHVDLNDVVHMMYSMDYGTEVVSHMMCKGSDRLNIARYVKYCTYVKYCMR